LSIVHPIPSHLTRHNSVGKPRRPFGDPVAPLKEMTRFIPNPSPAPRTLTARLETFDPKAAQAAVEAEKLVFHCVGDVGGVNGTATQEAVAEAMEEQIKEAAEKDVPRFLYIVGDVVYYNGESTMYKTEFYEPYQYYPALIFAIPGNHDGDTHVYPKDPPDTEPSLLGFNSSFCDATPKHVTPYRMTMTQPYAYWTLQAPFVTVIGLYSNVEGSLDARGRSEQQDFLTEQLAQADKDTKVIVAVHHPPYSLDSPHGGSPEILNSIDYSVQHSKRHPDAVLCGHVHNYQRFSRVVGHTKIPYIVAGAGGYANDPRSMHKLQKGIVGSPLPFKTTVHGVELEAYNVEDPGFLRVTATRGKLLFEYFKVPWGGGTPTRYDHVVA
jgi:3',5'-cyclic AMP phosphodiesterase CpdA